MLKITALNKIINRGNDNADRISSLAQQRIDVSIPELSPGTYRVEIISSMQFGESYIFDVHILGGNTNQRTGLIYKGVQNLHPDMEFAVGDLAFLILNPPEQPYLIGNNNIAPDYSYLVVSVWYL